MGWLKILGGALTQAIGDNLAASSEWGSLHPNLIAVIAPCDVQGKPTAAGMAVKAPLKDGSFQQQFNWTSPYEGMASDQKHPLLSAQLLSEHASRVSQALKATGVGGGEGEEGGGMFEQLAMQLKDVQGATAGRSGITKLNSRQVFVGHEPLKLSFTLVFRAYQDPIAEVEQPVQALLAMAYPKHLADDYLVTNAATAADAAQSGDVSKQKVLEALFPSETPVCVSLKYKGVKYAPMVIEEISFPMDSPASVSGDIYKEVQLTLGTLRSIDAQDLAQYRNDSVGSVVGEALNAVTNLFKK